MCSFFSCIFSTPSMCQIYTNLNKEAVQGLVSTRYVDVSQVTQYIKLSTLKTSAIHIFTWLVYIVGQVSLAFWLVLTYSLLEDSCMIVIIIINLFLLCFKMAKRFKNKDYILRNWAKIRYKKVPLGHWTGTRSRKK